MNLSKSVKSILSGLYLSVKRFPITISLSVAVAILIITMSELRPVEDTLTRITMTLALGLPLSLSIKLFFERKSIENIYKLSLAYAIGSILLLLYYLFLLKDINMVSITRYIALSLTFYLAFLFIPYFPHRQQFEMYIVKVVTGFFTTILYSVVLYAGLSAILFTINKLLGVQMIINIYFYTWILVVFIFAVSYFLSGIPLRNTELSSKLYPKLLRILILYIIMPLLTAYTIILYIYFGKIIATMQWPIGLVSHLVLWYSVIVTLVLFFITPILEESNWAYKFLKVAPKIILPLLVMMFISMGIRIRAYGLTEPRYYVVILALWVFCIMIYFSFKKKLKNIIIPVTLAFVALLSVFGPLSSYSLSKYSQNERYEKILIKNNMIKDENIQSSSDISKEDKANISSILDYFNRNHSLKDVKYLPKDFKIDDMNKVFGFNYEAPINQGANDYFFFMRSSSEKAIDIQGYDYLFDMRSLMDRSYSSDKDLQANYNYESGNVKISYKGNEVFTKDLNEFVKIIVNNHPDQGRETTLSSDEMTFIEENDQVRVKFLFQSISGRRNQSNENKDNKGLEFYMIIKVK